MSPTRTSAPGPEAPGRAATKATPKPATPKPATPKTATPKTATPARTARQLREAAVAARRRARPEADINPLRQGLRQERVPDPCAVVLFGATGDLAHRKVIPAIYELWRTNLLPSEFSLVAVARRPYTDESFAQEIRKSLEKYSRSLPIDEDAWSELSRRIVYQQLDFGDDDGYDRLSDRLDELDTQRGTGGNRLFYLATQPSQVFEIIRQMGRVGLDHEMRGGGWRRIVCEKPFGRDYESARHLNHEISKVFRESQVYRIDHYLGKETVRNLMVFRFGNGIFEPVWNRSYVDHVQITVAESIGAEGRGAFYEETGASRDILQNHLLQLMTLVAMEPPSSFQADALRDQKLAVLRAMTVPDPDSVRRDIVRGQYGPGWVQGEPAPGYRQEDEVDPESETETYVAGKFTIDDWRWSGVPFYLRAGKRLPKRATEIAIQFREVPLKLFRDSPGDPAPNVLAMRIQPDEGIMLRFAAKVPGLGLDVRTVNMDFAYETSFVVDSPDAYETLILDALVGDASLFTRADEVEAAWSIVTPIINAWSEMPVPHFPNYSAGSWGPDAADDLIERDGRRWRRI